MSESARAKNPPVAMTVRILGDTTGIHAQLAELSALFERAPESRREDLASLANACWRQRGQR